VMKRRWARTKPTLPQPRCPNVCSGGSLSAGYLRELLPGEIDLIGLHDLPKPSEAEKLCKCTYCMCVWIQPRATTMGKQSTILGTLDVSMWHPAREVE